MGYRDVATYWKRSQRLLVLMSKPKVRLAYEGSSIYFKEEELRSVDSRGPEKYGFYSIFTWGRLAVNKSL